MICFLDHFDKDAEAMSTNNWIELNLSEAENAAVKEAAALYKATYLDTIDNVFKIANGIEILRKRYYGSGVQGNFADALVQYGFVNRSGEAIDKAIRSHLKSLIDHEVEVRAWWGGVPARTKRDWLSAKAIYIHWKQSLKTDDKPRKPSPYVQMKETNVLLQEQL